MVTDCYRLDLRRVTVDSVPVIVHDFSMFPDHRVVSDGNRRHGVNSDTSVKVDISETYFGVFANEKPNRIAPPVNG
jgi:hypothetical protein